MHGVTDRDMEELVLRESIVSATGLNADSLQVGIKGDPSLRETAFLRTKYRNVMDEIYPRLEFQLSELLLNRGIYRLYIGFNSGEIRTNSIFDPLREETHIAERLLESGYIDRHFPQLDYEEKIAGMRELYSTLRDSRLFASLPQMWKSISLKRSRDWQPMGDDEITLILSSLKGLRDMPQYYLRTVSICIVQGIVRMQFNCDGTQLVSARNYRRFLQENAVL